MWILASVQLGHSMYANSPGNRVHCYAELALSSLAVAEVIASTHCAYPRRDGQAELAWVAGYISMWFAYPKTVTGPSTNRDRRKVTSLIGTNALPLYHVHTDQPIIASAYLIHKRFGKMSITGKFVHKTCNCASVIWHIHMASSCQVMINYIQKEAWSVSHDPFLFQKYETISWKTLHHR